MTAAIATANPAVASSTEAAAVTLAGLGAAASTVRAGNLMRLGVAAP
ncbi:MAG TPA: hypothetical protein VLA76_05155 [Candidatus Angelobacter sp.]|nr:hypothetical protein [Candidatus Angelobacter sp.]